MITRNSLALQIEQTKMFLDKACNNLERAQQEMNYLDDPLFKEAIQESAGSIDLSNIQHKISNVASILSDFEAGARQKVSDIELVEDDEGNLEWQYN